jgi:magnesium-transporting ATPase (P-type)
MDPGSTHWHALSVEDAVRRADVAPATGLDDEQVRARRAEHGENRLPHAAHRPAWLRLLLQFHNPLIYLLIGTGVITLALGDYVDSAVILLVVIVNAIIGFVQEGKAEQALDAVRDMLAAHATVLREGERRQVDATELVPGDVVLLEPGDKVPADLRLVRVRNLRVVESALTGESVPVEKRPEPVGEGASVGDRTCMAYSGTLVAFGQAQGVVVATGTSTEIGRIGTMVGEVRTLATPLVRRLDQFARQITVFVLVVGTLTFLYGRYVAGMPTLDVFLAVVGLSVAAIPEGLPAIVTIVLAIGTRTMARKRAVVRRLPAVETLGSVTVICSDKTGTLTRNEMTAVRVFVPGRELRVTGTGYAPEGGFHEGDRLLDPQADAALSAIAHCARLCNDARIAQDEAGGWQLVGDPTEGALLALAHKAGLDPDDTGRRFPRLDEVPFESDRRWMATLHHDHAGRRFVLLKGAPERVLALCTHELGGGRPDPAHWNACIERAASAGERVLALARCEVPQDTSQLDERDVVPRFELLGLVGIIDPPRDEAVQAVAECRGAGIRVKMITGDHAATAAAIGRSLGLSVERTLTGDAIEALDDAALRERAVATDVFARASPEHKLRLVAALQAEGHLVAMTGDGVNDAPALKAADIGVAMGNKGTDAAREASDLVLTDDNFATIARAVREGRVVFDNIKKSLLFMLPTNCGEAGVILVAILLGLALPVTPGQILWVNTVTAVTLGLALAFEPGEPRVMAFAPRPTDEPLITRALGIRILYVALLMMATTFLVFEWELSRTGSIETARTAAVNMLVMHELVYLFQARHFTASALRTETLTGNPVAIRVALALVVVQAVFTYAPPMQALFQTVALDAASWALIAGLGAATFLAVDLEKAVWRRIGILRM